MDNLDKDSFSETRNGDIEGLKRDDGRGEDQGELELDIVVANDVVMMAEKIKDKEERTWIRLSENGIAIKVDNETISRRPSRTKFFFNPKMMTNREVTLLALLALVREKRERADSAQDAPAAPIEALDAFAASGISGMRWKKILASNVNVFLCENDKETFQRLMENCAENGFDVRHDPVPPHSPPPPPDSCSIVAYHEDCNVVMLQRGFDFIHLDPFGSTVQHLDAAFRNVRHGGIVVLTSTDTGSLFGKVPTVAKRNYDAFVIKTEYFRELAARMVLAAAARSAAKCNKGFQVLYTLALEHFVQVAVRICRGAQPADQTLEKVAKIVHCLVCEERTVVPNSNHPFDAAECLECVCLTSSTASSTSTQQQSRGRNRILLGPVWCGPIFDAQFVGKMETIAGQKDLTSSQRKQRDREGKKEGVSVENGFPVGVEQDKIPFSSKTREMLHLMKVEADCASSSSASSSSTKNVVVNDSAGEESVPKRRRVSGSENANTLAPSSVSPSLNHSLPSEGLRLHSDGEPVFYYNTHSHLPKGLELMKVERLVDFLRQEGFRE